MSNRNFQIGTTFIVFVIFSGLAFADSGDRPNVIVIMSDDQGGGDYGFMGNEVIRTPELDDMAARGGVLTRFYVSPVCAPTRACLMTGRYNYRTRCIDTYVGRAMMDTEEVTIAEFLRDSGYNTGIYGKWHMGDNYPLRAMDQGFQDSLVHRGGGIGQPSDPIGAEGKYTDPTLFKNGVETPMKGYCTDIYFDAAMNFISDSVESKKNFFTYIATNAPHGPFHDVPAKLYDEYKKVDFRPILVHKMRPEKYKSESDKLARIAAMITNIDENIGRLFAKLTELEIADNTIVMYLNDNGPNTMRYVGNMRGMKTRVDDGGIRSPLIFHWPKKVRAGTRSDAFTAHIDILPSIMDACGVAKPEGHRFDGRSFLPVLTQEKPEWPERTVVFQTHRGNVPRQFHHFALHRGPWKLVHPTGFGIEMFKGDLNLELYNLKDDPRQEKDLADSNPKKLAELKQRYEEWFEDVSSTRSNNYDPPRIVIGTEHEPVSVLTRQDWRHVSGRPWGRDSNGFWLLEAREPASYKAEVILSSGDNPAGKATISAGGKEVALEIAPNQSRGHFVDLSLPSGKLKLAVDLRIDGKVMGPHQVILTKK